MKSFPLITALLKSLLSDHFSIEISTAWPLFYWNLHFLITFLLKSLFSVTFWWKSLLSVTFWSLPYWNLYFLSLSNWTLSLSYWNFHFLKSLFLMTFLLKLLSDDFPTDFPIEKSTFCHFLSTFLLQSLLFDDPTFWWLCHWNLYFLITWFPIDFSTFSSLSYWKPYFLCTGTTCNRSQPSAHHYKARSNLQLHAPITRRHHLQPSEPSDFSPPL